MNLRSLTCLLLGFGLAAPSLPAQGGRPEIPRHQSHIRIAMLAYNGTPMSAFEDKLLRERVDLVVAAPRYLSGLAQIAPNTPRLLYSNVSNLYGDLLLDWLTFADRQGFAREAAFYHAVRPVPFSGDSPSSVPVTWFWSVRREGKRSMDQTREARGQRGDFPLPAPGEVLVLSHPDRFREVQVEVQRPPGSDWGAVWEYPSEVTPQGQGTVWIPLPLIQDGTRGFRRSGRIEFDPPADWKTTSVDSSFRSYAIRIRGQGVGQPPLVRSLLGRDYVAAGGKRAGTIPAFDDAADGNGDGYLNDEEYARRAPGKEARFVHESRLFHGSYGQMRFAANPATKDFRAWACDYHKRFLQRQEFASGLFMDNSEGRVRIRPLDARESTTTFARDFGAVLGAVAETVAPRWLLVNTAGGGKDADEVLRVIPFSFDEFALRPLAHRYPQFEDVAAEAARRARLTQPRPHVILDVFPQNGSPTEQRMQLAALAAYYLLADPEYTFLMYNGGNEPASSWTRHWIPAATYDVGAPVGDWALFAEGNDPAAPLRRYRVYARRYQKALVVYKPLSHIPGDWKTQATLGDDSATEHDLEGRFHPLSAEGTQGEPWTRVRLRNGEGAILIPEARGEETGKPGAS